MPGSVLTCVTGTERSQDFDAHHSMEGLLPQFLSLEFSVGILRKIVVKQGRTQSENHLQLS